MPLVKKKIVAMPFRRSLRWPGAGRHRSLPPEAEPFLLVKARQRARTDVQKALAGNVAVTRVNLVQSEDGRLRRVVEKVHPDGRVEQLDEQE